MKGKKRGTGLGFPTANVRLHKNTNSGIYASSVKYKGNIFKSVSFIGAAETFGETEILSETYILNFNNNLYGQWISVKLLKKIRDIKKFKNKEMLIRQINLDVEKAKLLLKWSV